MENIYDPQKLTAELQAAGLPVVGVSSIGEVDYSRDLTKAEVAAANATIAAHDPTPGDAVILLEMFFKAGVSLEEVVMVLWSQAAHADSGAVVALAQKIDSTLHGM